MRKFRKFELSTRRLTLESLENREMLAGNVTVAVRGGLVTITGDDNANQVALYQQGDGTFSLSGNDGEVFTGPTTNLVVRNLTVNLNGGDDIFTVSSQPDPQVFDVIPAEILGTININGGTGFDAMFAGVIGRLAGTLMVPAVAISIDAGNEPVNSPDLVQVTNSSAAAVTVNTWAGNDTVNLLNVFTLTTTVNTGVPSVRVGGADTDVVNMQGVTALTGLINLGTADPLLGNALIIRDGLFGNLIVNGGQAEDFVNVFNTLVGGTLTVNTYGGNDGLYLEQVRTGMTRADYQAVATQLATMFGVDIGRLPFNLFALLNTLPTLPGVMTINTGAGDDTVTMLDDSSTFAIYIYLDQGDDELRATNVDSTFAYYFGGLGFDSRLLTALDGFFLDLQFEDILPPAQQPLT